MTDKQLLQIDELLMDFQTDEDLDDLIDYLKFERINREDLRIQLEEKNDPVDLLYDINESSFGDKEPQIIQKRK